MGTYNSKLMTLNARFSGNYQHVIVGMYPPFDYFEHRRACAIKQRQRDARFESLPDLYKGPLTSHQRSILDAPIASLVHDVHSGTLSAVDILRTYGKTAAVAQERTNCITELLLPEAEAWSKSSDVNLKGPLAGIPVSLKSFFRTGETNDPGAA